MIKYLHTDATISKCGKYRYRLARRWGDGPTALWIMLNPSTADALEDDPTIRRCVGFSVREGCGRLLVGNLYAFRATDPRELSAEGYPVGPDNLDHLRAMAVQASVIIAGWGACRGLNYPYVRVVYSHLQGTVAWRCLGTTKNGAPRHPLYVGSATPLEAYRP